MYDSFFRPYVAKHETEIDRNLLELRTRAGDIAVSYWQRAFSYGQTRIYDILQFVAAQSTPAPRPAQVVDYDYAYVVSAIMLECDLSKLEYQLSAFYHVALDCAAYPCLFCFL